MMGEQIDVMMMSKIGHTNKHLAFMLHTIETFAASNVWNFIKQTSPSAQLDSVTTTKNNNGYRI